jgi:hypothetical protein
VLGLDVLPRDVAGRDVVDVTVPRRLRLQPRPGVRPHEAEMTDEDLVDLGGLRVVSAARAVVDVARAFGLVEGVAAGDAALRHGATDVRRVEWAVERAGRLRWVTRARTMLDHLDGRAESLPESRLRVGLVLEGGPRFDAQVDLYDADGHHAGRCDLFLDGVNLEYDGYDRRQETDAFTRDRRRGNDISALGVETRRFAAADMRPALSGHRWAVVQKALALARTRDRSRVCFGPDTLRAPTHRPRPTVAEVAWAQARRTA